MNPKPERKTYVNHEKAPTAARLPGRSEIAAAYRKTVRDALKGREVSFTSENPNFRTGPLIGQAFITENQAISYYVDHLVAKQQSPWWVHTIGTLQQHYGVADVTINSLQLHAVHSVDVVHNERRIGGLDICDIGPEPADDDTIRTVIRTLEQIDQFSGGLLPAHEIFQRLVLLNGTELPFRPSGAIVEGHQVGGYADFAAGEVVINLARIKELEQVSPKQYHDSLEIIIYHEVLGHMLEHIALGSSGSFFRRYMNYSLSSSPHPVLGKIHSEITPIDPEHQGAETVSMYGKSNPSEDVATSVQALMTKLYDLRWADVPDFAKTTPDPYRFELVMQLFEIASEAAGRELGRRGAVAADLNYTDDTNEHGSVHAATRFEINEQTGISHIEETLDELYYALLGGIPANPRINKNCIMGI